MNNLLIVDDHPPIRLGIMRMMRDSSLISEFQESTTPKEAVSKTDECDLVVTDIYFKSSSFDGISLLKKTKRERPSLPVLMYTMIDNHLLAQRSIEEGVDGYITKRESPDTFRKAISEIISGGTYFSKLSGNPKAKTWTLTEREFDIFRRIGFKQSNTEIADSFDIKITTLHNYRTKIAQKLDIETENLGQRAREIFNLEGAV